MSKRLPVVRRSFDASAYWGRFGGEKLCGEGLSGAPTLAPVLAWAVAVAATSPVAVTLTSPAALAVTVASET